MSLFSKILEKLGLRKEQDQPATSTPASVPAAAPPKPTATAPTISSKPTTPSASGTPAARTPPATSPSTKPATPASSSGTSAAKQAPTATPATVPAAVPTAPKPISEVDVVKQLEQKAKGTGLNWKQSISDLLFLLDIDNSRAARIELAKELGAPADVMSDSARMNTWLHKTVLKKIAENGGNIPQELLD